MFHPLGAEDSKGGDEDVPALGVHTSLLGDEVVLSIGGLKHRVRS